MFSDVHGFAWQILNRPIESRPLEAPGGGVATSSASPLVPHLAPLPLIPQQIITSGTRKDCVRLRGLPYEAQVEHILDFLGEHAKHIVYRGVHMVYNAQVGIGFFL